MSAREILFRGAEQLWGIRERLARTDRAAPAGELETGAWLRNAWSRAFFFRASGGSPDALRKSFEEHFPETRDEILERADAICSGTLRLFGKDIALTSGRVHWLQDWETQASFPREFYRSIPTFDVNRRADAKRVWELNRQQFLVTLGQAYFLTRNSKYSTFAIRLLDSWIEANPPYTGLNWKEALEAGLRLLSWAWTLQMLEGCELPPEFAARTMASLRLQHEFIAHHLSVYSSPNTHLLGEALALFSLGHIFPELPAARRTATQGLEILELELGRQVLDDGSHFEKSAYYHGYALEMCLLATILGQQRGITFSPRWRPRIEKMAEFLLCLVRPDGSLARFGDDDGGKTICLGQEDYYDPRPLLAVSAVLFERPDFKHAAGALPQEVWWLLGPQGARKYLEMPSSPPPSGAQCFPNAGLAAWRSGWNREDLWVVAQASPWAPLTAGHSHGALLSFEVYAGGHAFLIDPGTFTYSESGPWRDAFRGSEAHNTVQIDDHQWWIPTGTFRWQPQAKLETSLEAAAASVTADYRGVTTEGPSLRHRRSLRMNGLDSLTVQDSYEGGGSHRLRCRLHFAPGWRLGPAAENEFRIAREGKNVRLLLRGFGAFSWQVAEGSESPIAGWVSERFNQKAPAPVLYLEENNVPFPAEREMQFVFGPLS